MFYIIIDGKQAGPFSRDELLSRGLNPNSMVWRAGMSDWMPASQVAELQSLFDNKPRSSRFNINKEQEAAQANFNRQENQGYQQPYQQPQQQQFQQPYQEQQPYQQPFQQPFQPQQPYRQHTNWMPWAIICTVLGLCSCIGLILGAIGISKASSANKAYMMGDNLSGDSYNKSAQVLVIIGLVFDVIGTIYCGVITLATM